MSKLDVDDNIQKAILLSQLRSRVYKKVMAIPGGPEQWAFIMGKIRVDRDGRKIKLDYAVRLVLEDIIDDLQTDEKEKKLGGFGMTPPDHPEDLNAWFVYKKGTALF